MNFQPSKSPQTVLIAMAILLAALFVLAGLTPMRMSWGFNDLRYFSLYLTMGFAALIIVILISAGGRQRSGRFASILESFLRLPRSLQIATIAIASALMFYLFRVHVHSLGDGYARIHQVEQGFYLYASEPLDFFLHAIIYRGLNIIGHYRAESVYVIYSIACGAFFAVAIYLYKMPEPLQEHSGFIKLMIFVLGGSQLFFGYAESYSLYYPALILFVLYGIRYLMTGEGFAAAVLFYALSQAAHLTTVFFLLPFIYLLYLNWKASEGLRGTRKYLPPVVLIVTLAVIFSLQLWARFKYGNSSLSISDNVLPLFSMTDYSVLSLHHLWDILNETILIMPVWPLLLLGLLLSPTYSGIDKRLKTFLTLTAISGGIFLLAIDPKLSFPRDWDLFASPTAVLVLSLIFVFVLRHKFSSTGFSTKPLILRLSVAFFSIWILTNAVPSRQLARAEDLLALSEKGQGYGTELLAYYYSREANDNEKAERLLQGISGKARNARVYEEIAQLEAGLKHWPQALQSARSGIALDSTQAPLYFLAGTALQNLDSSLSALPYLIKNASLEPPSPQNIFNIAELYLKVDSPATAVKYFREVVRLDPGSSGARFRVAQSYYLMGMLDSADVYAGEGLRLNPNNPQGQKLMALIQRDLTARRK